jgi:hypothetical protein
MLKLPAQIIIPNGESEMQCTVPLCKYFTELSTG